MVEAKVKVAWLVVNFKERPFAFQLNIRIPSHCLGKKTRAIGL
jgi:hypothetical protein